MAAKKLDLEDVTEALNRAPFCLEKEVWQVAGPCQITKTSLIYRGRSNLRTGLIAIKATDSATASEQFQALKFASAALASSSDFLSPAPISLLSDEGILVMDWIEGHSVDQIARGGRLGHRGLENLGSRIASMLRRLHDFETTDMAPLPVESVRRDLEEQLLATGPRGNRILLPAIDLVDYYSKRVGQIGVKCARLHGDFKPANIVQDGTRLACIDGNFRNIGPVLQDLAHFLNHFALDLYFPLALYNQFYKKRILTSVVLGYDCKLADETALALDWLRLCKCLALFMDLTEQSNLFHKKSYAQLTLAIEIHRLASGLKKWSSE